VLQFRNSNRALSDDEVIQDSIELETSGCTCRNQFTGYRIEEGKYRVSYSGPSDVAFLFLFLRCLHKLAISFLCCKHTVSALEFCCCSYLFLTSHHHRNCYPTNPHHLLFIRDTVLSIFDCPVQKLIVRWCFTCFCVCRRASVSTRNTGCILF